MHVEYTFHSKPIELSSGLKYRVQSARASVTDSGAIGSPVSWLVAFCISTYLLKFFVLVMSVSFSSKVLVIDYQPRIRVYEKPYILFRKYLLEYALHCRRATRTTIKWKYIFMMRADLPLYPRDLIGPETIKNCS